MSKDRHRLSLNLSDGDYRALNELAAWWHQAGLTLTINRAVGIARRIYGAAHPEVWWAPDDPRSKALPAYWARHEPQPDGTEIVHRIEMV